MEDYLPHILIAIGVAVIASLSYISIRAVKSNSWKKTPGFLLNKGTRLHISRDIQAKVVDWQSVHIDVEYEYEVDGVKYISKRATFSDMVNKPISSLNKILKEYLATENVVVYYNPKDHSDSVLFPGARIWNFAPMITGGIFIAAGIFLLNQ
ncbi:DUF3592 domain-containing protein [Marinobacterium mangrovicola]|uniref:Uncharacterized protein DUF3592 n=1 Tax=Marinobacterium mangrovicola TaxID=1476959 RepID=A0A4R1G4P1_9GAMM|nr:DUF3592 domain-containing protein [Marinobacterium mangrovicola]TCK02654.1 uncharacterized protein DUF3592 [Marinobacterium mangrovicola]